MEDGNKNGLYTKVGIVAVVVAILVGGFGLSSVYGEGKNAIQFVTPFTSTGIPLCGGEVVDISGTAHFVFHELVSASDALHQNVHMNFLKAEGTDTSGNIWRASEVDHSSVNQNLQTGVFHTVVTARLIQEGKGENSGIIMELQTVLDPDGNARTTVQHTQKRCNGN